MAKGKAQASGKQARRDQRLRDAQDAQLLEHAIREAATEAQRIEAQERALAAQRALAEQAKAEAAAAAASADDDVLPEDVPVFAELPGEYEVPAALRAEPSLVAALSTVDPTATSKAPSVADAAPRVDYSQETPRERELRLRDVRKKRAVARQIDHVRRGGKKAAENATFREAPSFVGDERADEIATRPALIAAYVRRFAEWLLEGARGTRLLDAADAPEHFALLFRFDLTRDPVARCARSLLGSQLDVLLVGVKRVVHFIATDYADGVFAAVKNKALDPTLTPSNVLAVLPGGVAPTGLGIRMTGLDQLAQMPHLSAHAYPRGIPADLVHAKRTWGADLGGESAADRLARAIAAGEGDDDDEAFDEDEDEDAEGAGGAGGAGGDGDDSEVARMVRRELRALGRTRFPLSRAIMDAFKTSR
jgi:hypothetical protein